jgi:hypothetical protein
LSSALGPRAGCSMPSGSPLDPSLWLTSAYMSAFSCLYSCRTKHDQNQQNHKTCSTTSLQSHPCGIGACLSKLCLCVHLGALLVHTLLLCYLHDPLTFWRSFSRCFCWSTVPRIITTASTAPMPRQPRLHMTAMSAVMPGGTPPVLQAGGKGAMGNVSRRDFVCSCWRINKLEPHRALGRISAALSVAQRTCCNAQYFKPGFYSQRLVDSDWQAIDSRCQACGIDGCYLQSAEMHQCYETTVGPSMAREEQVAPTMRWKQAKTT